MPLPGLHIGGNEIGTLMDIITARMVKTLVFTDNSLVYRFSGSTNLEYPALGMLIGFMGESTIFMSLNLLFSPAILVCKVQNAKIAILVTEKEMRFLTMVLISK